jgi:hypothetical protein
MRLLFDNKWACCVCRNADLPIVVHHIEPWAASKSHDASNLAVLCPNDHAKAHRTGDLEQNLSVARLRYSKRRWEKEVKDDDTLAIRMAVHTVGEYWHYFNLLRLTEMAKHHGISLKSLPHYADAEEVGIVNAKGEIVFDDFEGGYAYTGRHNRLRYWLARDLFFSVLDEISVENISDRLDRSDLGITLIPKDIIYVEGLHRFRPLGKIKNGEGQETQGSRSANSVRVIYTFDRWYATSSSAHSQWLSGGAAVGSFCRVGSIGRHDGKIIIKCSVMAICQGMPNMKTRSYANDLRYSGHYFSYDDQIDGEESEEDEDFDDQDEL